VKRRLTVITEIIAPYRIPVFNCLARRDDIDVHVMFLSETDPSLRQWSVYKNEIQFSYEVLPSFRRRIGRYNLLINSGVKDALRKSQPNVILCGGYNYLASWQAQRWAGKHRVPFLLWLESTAVDQRRQTTMVEWLKRRFLARCQGFVVPGKASQAYLNDLAISDKWIFRAPNAVDNRFFLQQAEQARNHEDRVRADAGLPDRYLLYVGRLVKAKGVFDLLDAYGSLDPSLRSRLSLVLVGDGLARPALERIARSILPGSIHFAGFVQKHGLAPFYAFADALVFPTHSDTWGFVVNEAMACACPVIASNRAGCVPDLLEEDWNGKLVPPKDAAKLASAMEYLSTQDELRPIMGARSVDRILSYSPEACASGIAEAVAACA
jgi:glycosyltransferase involved in cell wall biosynthesis